MSPNAYTDGDAPLQVLLAQLPSRVEKKGLRAAVNAGATPVMRTMRTLAPSGPTGLLKKAIGKKVKTYKGSVAAIIGARRDVSGNVGKRRVVPSRYLHLVDKGTKGHAQGHGHHPGAKAQPFVEESYRQNRDKSRSIITTKLKDVVVAEALKLGKR